MTIRSWATFTAMAFVWGAVSNAGAHYAAVAVTTWRARRAELWFEHQVRHLLQ